MENLIERLRLNPTAKDIITFCVLNNFGAVKKNLMKLGYGVGYNGNSLNNPNDAIMIIDNLNNQGYAIDKIINVPYIPTVKNETGVESLQGNAGQKIDWGTVAAVGVSVLTVLSQTLLGGDGLNTVTNSDNAPAPPPAQEKSFKDEKPVLFWGLIALMALLSVVAVFGAVRKNKIALFTSLPLLAGAAIFFISESNKKTA